MNRVLPSLLSCLALAGPACASHSEDARTASVEAPPVVAAPEDGKKARAPVELALSASGTRDALTLSLAVRATGDIARAVSRFTLPDGVVLVSGALEQELGPRAAGSEATASIVVRAPATGSPIVFAGVDCHLSRGVKLYGVTQITLAPDGPGPDDVRVRGLDHDALRATPARPRP